MVRVLFVCLGNICRSPMAEGLARRRVRREGLDGWIQVASAGTGAWHAGEPADPRTRAVLRRWGAPDDMVARQLRADDFDVHDWILVMDEDNARQVLRRAPAGARARVRRVLDPVGGGEVADPWTEGPEAFEALALVLDEAIGAWIARWRSEAGDPPA